ncbi:MAG: hypothetical protein ACREHE_01765 [Rhizomicrobium sp.]
MVIDAFPPAYSFRSPLSLEQMRARLNAATEWHWREGDSGWVGDYVSTRPVPEGSWRLYRQGRAYVMEMRKRAYTRAWHDVMRKRLLPLLEATAIKPDEGFD